jgi:hypothetical protein
MDNAESSQASQSTRSGNHSRTWIPSIVTISSAVGLTMIAIAGKSSYTPKILDEMLGLSKYVERTAFSKIDSGYSKVLFFDPAGDPRQLRDNSTILFYAEKGQPVSLTIEFEGSVAPDGLKVIIDGQEVTTRHKSVSNADITNKLFYDLNASETTSSGLHTLRVVPVARRVTVPFGVNVLVLVHRSQSEESAPIK